MCQCMNPKNETTEPEAVFRSIFSVHYLKHKFWKKKFLKDM